MQRAHYIRLGLAVIAAWSLTAAAGELVWRLGDTAGEVLNPATGKTQLRFQSSPVLEKNPARPELAGVRFAPGVPADLRAESTAETDLTDDFGLEVFCRPDVVSHYRTILWKGDRSVKPERIAYFLSIHEGKLEFKFKDAVGEWVVFSTSEAVIQPGLWQRIAVQFHGGRPRFSVNGKEVPAGDGYAGRAPMAKLESNRDDLYIGSGRAGAVPAYGFVGVIGSVKLATPAAVVALDSPEGDALSRSGLMAEAERLNVRALQLKQNPGAEENVFRAALKRNDLPAALSALAAWNGRLERIAAEQRSRQDREAYRAVFDHASSGTDFALFTMPTGLTFRRDSGFFRRLTPAAPVTLKAARGESEGFQVLPGADRKPLAVDLTFSGFVNDAGVKLPASAVHWGEVRDITAPKTDLGDEFAGPPSPEFVGSWPDLIVEENPERVVVPAGSVTPVFFRVDVPRDAAPGRYQGTITVSDATGEIRLPVTLQVRPFELPRRNSIPVVFSFFPDFYKEWYNRTELTAEESAAINRFLSDYRIPPNNIYANDLYPDLDTIAGLDLGFSTIGYFLYDAPLSESALDKLVDTYRQRLAPVAAAGLADRVYLYTFDEISLTDAKIRESRYAAARQIMGRFAEEFPAMKRVQTSEPVPELLDSFNVWCPTFPFFKDDNPLIGKVHDGGGEFWWYSADAPYKPYPNFFLGYPLADLRVIMSMTWMKEVRGILYWCVNREWRTNLGVRDRWLEDSRVWDPSIINIFSGAEVHRNGMGNFIYPGPDGRLYPSLRLENLRDGIEDYEYYTLLRTLAGQLREAAPGSPLVAAAEEALRVPAEVAEDIDRYNHHPAALMRQHDRLGDLIEQVQAALASQKEK